MDRPAAKTLPAVS